MSGTKTTDERIEALEIRLTYQDDTIEKLNAAIMAQWAQIEALQRQLKQVGDKIDEVSAASANDPSDERPPHY